jgi:hypothetical protein
MCSPAVQFIVLVCSSIGLRHVKTAMYPAGQKKLVVNGIKHENMEKYKNRHEGGYFRNRLFCAFIGNFQQGLKNVSV